MATREIPHDLTLSDWVTTQAPTMQVTASSDPEPLLQEYNVVAVSDDVDAARAVVLAWERIEPQDGAVGFVALATPSSATASVDEDRSPPGPDPTHVVQHSMLSANRGLVPGALIGAVVVTLLAWVFNGWTPVLAGAAVGGAAIGGVAGAFWTFTSGTGWGAAYRDSFVEPGQTDLAVASIHSDEREVIAEAIDVAARHGGVRLYGVSRAGNAVDLHRG